ncbi:MAG: 2-hydroxyacyl-CoA dehydratase family protein, partial [Planctomycetota bacterium]
MSSCNPEKIVLFSCPFVPAEWIAAHGLKPCRLIPSGNSRIERFNMGQGICPFTTAFLDESLSDPRADAVIVTTLCDQMRRAGERASGKPVFLLNLP